MTRWIIFAFLVAPCYVRAQEQVSSPHSGPSIQIVSGIGVSPVKVGYILWNAEMLFAFAELSRNSRFWIGIAPTMNPEDAGDENAADGFVPFVIEYEHDLIGTSTIPFLYANAGAGPQFGDRSKHRLFQTAMFTAGTGIHTSGSAGFFGKVGASYNTALQNSRFYLILDAGVAF